MPPPTLKTAVLKPGSSLDRDAFLAWTKRWLSRNATDEEIGFAFGIDLKNPENVLSIIFSQEVMNQLNIPADMQVIDVVGLVIKAVIRKVKETLSNDIADMIALALPDVPAPPQSTTITQDQFDMFVEQLQSAITVNVPDKAQVQTWAREGMADELNNLRRQIADLTLYVVQIQAGGAAVLPSFDLAEPQPILTRPALNGAAVIPQLGAHRFTSILPPNATELALALEQVWARRLARITSPIKDLWNPDTCPEQLLPWLAWSVGVRVWDDSWPIGVKREVIRNSIPILKMGGTPIAVRTALKTLGVDCTLNEWFALDEGGQRYGEFPDFIVTVETADVVQSALGNNTQFGMQAKKVLSRVKPVRSGMNLRFVTHAETAITAATTTRVTTRQTLRSAPRIPPVQMAQYARFAAAATTRAKSHAALRFTAPWQKSNHVAPLAFASAVKTHAKTAHIAAPMPPKAIAHVTHTYPLGRAAVCARARSTFTSEIAA
ncbi:MAG: phage tail protein I [Planktomarina sp.]